VPSKILIWSAYSVTLLTFKMVWWILLGGIIVSFVAGTNFHPAIVLIRQMSDQMFKPFRLLLPPMGGLDFSPIFAFIALNFLQVLFVQFAIESGLPVWLSVGF
jgi:YggT family protein